MDLNTQIKFASIYSKFSNETHSCNDIAEIICKIRESSNYISNDAKFLLLQIPLVVLKNQVELKDEIEWAHRNADYFSGNYNKEPYHSLFKSGKFDLNVMTEFLESIMNDTNSLNSDFHLRNPEVTLRDDVVIKYSNFKESGKIYMQIMNKAFEI